MHTPNHRVPDADEVRHALLAAHLRALDQRVRLLTGILSAGLILLVCLAVVALLW